MSGKCFVYKTADLKRKLKLVCAYLLMAHGENPKTNWNDDDLDQVQNLLKVYETIRIQNRRDPGRIIL